jgi:ankyrin repeat protein
MPTRDEPAARLPERPSREHLRKAAKRLARDGQVKLASAQAELARRYGHRNWAELMGAVDAAAAPARSPLADAAARADVPRVRALLADGADPDGIATDDATPLFLACDTDAPADDRLAAARLLVEAGAFTRAFGPGGATPLHAAARRGPLALVELLLANDALSWVEDAKGRRPFHHAEDGRPLDREAILFLLADGPKIADAKFRAAVEAIQHGDVAALDGLLDQRPNLLHERAVEPEAAPRGYFSDPKLFWFVANNPTLVPEPPANIVEVAQLMIDRGVEPADLDYTLELAMTDGVMPPQLRMDLVRTLVEAGAAASEHAVLMTLGHRQTEPVLWLIDHGLRESAAASAGLGRVAQLAERLPAASEEEKNAALAMAVINRQREAARLCLEAGADPNHFMACHSHSTPVHQAALDGDVALLELLVAHGARLDIADTLWRGTPLGWSIHGKQGVAEAFIRERLAP